jgi:hypothetical protein
MQISRFGKKGGVGGKKGERGEGKTPPPPPQFDPASWHQEVSLVLFILNAN